MSKSPTSRRKKVLSVVAFGGVVLLTLIVLGYAVLDFLGRRDWDQTKRELLARGEPLSFSEMLSPEIPDEQNFFATQSWKDMIAWEERKASKEAIPESERKADPFRVLNLTGENGKKPVARGQVSLGKLSDLEGYAKLLQSQGLVPVRSGMSGAEVVLQSFEPAKSLLTELADATARPGARFPWKYDGIYGIPKTPHVSRIRDLYFFLLIRAVARMEAGDSRGAADDILLILKVGGKLRSEPLAISMLVGQAGAAYADIAIWECTVRGVWKDGELVEMQSALADALGTKETVKALRGERGIFNQWMSKPPSYIERGIMMRVLVPDDLSIDSVILRKIPEELYPFLPSGIVLLNQAHFNRSIQQLIEAIQKGDFDVAQEIVSRYSPDRGSFDLRYSFSRAMTSTFVGMAIKNFDVQNWLQLGITACALERYRLKKGSYPADLAALTPKYLSTVPVDLVTREEIGYKAISGDDFTISCTSLKWKGNKQLPNGISNWRRKLPRTSEVQ